MKAAVRQLRFNVVQGLGQYVDIGQCLSLVNRRLYRQGYNYFLESVTWNPTGAPATQLQIASVPTTWITFNAWKKSKALWNRMNREAGIAYPKYHDFKVFMDIAHYENMAATYASINLIPRDFGVALYDVSGAEWQYSQFVFPQAGGSAAAREDCCHFLGGDTTVNNAALSTDGSNAIIQGYADTRVTVGFDEPELPGDASSSWTTELFDTGETESDIINHLEGHNDQPPYAHGADIQTGDNPIYPGGSESAVNGNWLVNMTTTLGETIAAPGGEIPCGLLEVSASTTGVLELRLAPGRYNGVAAIPMGKVQT